MTVRTLDAAPHHARLIADYMRERDIVEILAGWNDTPYRAIVKALAASYYAKTAFVGLEPLAIYGLAPLTVIGGTARLWIFATRAVDRHPFAFSRASKKALPELFVHCNLATNIVDVSHESVMKWLTWLGGTCVLPAHPRGGSLFAQFILTSPTPGAARACQQG